MNHTNNNSSSWWCDEEYGWDYSVETPCFSSTMLELPSIWLFIAMGMPRLSSVLRLPLVKPATSLVYYIKISATCIALCCCGFLVALEEPPSASLVAATTSACVAWLLALALLVASYQRHVPTCTLLRAYWVTQLFINIIIFVNKKGGNSIFRGLYCATCVVLAVMSLFAQDQTPYNEVVIINTRLDSGVRLDSEDNIDEENLLQRSLSSSLLITGASTSKYSSTLTAWNEALRNEI